MNPYVSLLIGVVCAGVGGELFVKGIVSLARKARIPSSIVASTIAAFATSSPELSVTINSALAGKPEIALGDALGSNVVNIALILALALLISGIRTPRNSLKRDFPLALLAPVLTGVLFIDGELSRIDGIVLLGLFVAWLALNVLEARNERAPRGDDEPVISGWKTLAACAAGLAFLVASGSFIVEGAVAIAESFGIGPFVIGATIVCVGTSIPELATSLISKLRGHDEIGLGTVLGSNVFNGLFIVPLAAVISPIALPLSAVAPALMFGMIVVAMSFPTRDGMIGRRRGVLLIALYVIYVSTILQG
jgi:cation:H+ antiporter